MRTIWLFAVVIATIATPIPAFTQNKPNVTDKQSANAAGSASADSAA